MTVEINGNARDFPELRTIADLVQHLGLPGSALLIEHNGTALRRDEWGAIGLSGGDRIEVLRIAAGG